MIKGLLKRLFCSEIDYMPRFIEKDSVKRAVTVQIQQDVNDYRQVKENFNSLPSAVKARYAYALISSK